MTKGYKYESITSELKKTERVGMKNLSPHVCSLSVHLDRRASPTMFACVKKIVLFHFLNHQNFNYLN